MNLLQESNDYYESLSNEHQKTMLAISTSLMFRKMKMAEACIMAMKSMKRKLSRLSDKK